MAKSLGKPLKTYEIEYENYRDNLERYYFFLIEFLKDNMDYELHKVEDIYASSETSSFWGNIEQRKGAQQDKAAQYLGLIGNLLKSLQQILHDLRIMDERFNFYKDSKKGDKAAEIALKSMWTDLVEGGPQNAKSVFGLAQQVGFATLPDLFFEVTPKNKNEIDKVVNAIEHVNENVKNLLRRKLYQYYDWKESTEKEIETRRAFTLKYLRQHYNVIKLYISWVRPYLKNIQKLQSGETLNKLELITGSEGATMDLEILGVKRTHQKLVGSLAYSYKKYFPVIQLKIHWRARPLLEFRSEYQRGALHLGRANIKFNAYTLTEKDIENYRKEKDKEDRELLAAVNASIDAVWDELEARLIEADDLAVKEKKESRERAEKEKLSKSSTSNPLVEVGRGMSQLFAPFKIQAHSRQERSEKEERVIASNKSKMDVKITYETFKKAHGMVQW